jgi:16S rRNA (guanine527-N7)-methyltransferase
MDGLKSGALSLGILLGARQLEQFEKYYRSLVVWNKKINLTAIAGYEDVQIKHFLDSLSIVKAISIKVLSAGLSVIDVGTGAGLPGLPLKIAFPGIRLVLLEATAKKTEFLKHLVRSLEVYNVEVVTGRAEDLAHDAGYREKFGLVLSRAVAGLPALVELSLPFAATGGVFIAQKKGRIDSEISDSRKAIDMMGGKLREVKPVELAGLNDGRCLVIIDKLRPTPTEYPRRSGMPVKRPIR